MKPTTSITSSRAHSGRISDRTQEARPTAPPARVVEDLLRENAELRRMVSELESFKNLAYRDPLTGLWNRRYFEERMDEEISHSRRDPNRKFSVLIADMNDLKLINDVEGHHAGDIAIKAAANFLKSRLREYDICCRTGGDEFAVILLDSGAHESEQLIARLRRELDKANLSSDIRMGLAFGTSSFPEECANARELYLEADAAMYRDKRRQKTLQGRSIARVA